MFCHIIVDSRLAKCSVDDHYRYHVDEAPGTDVVTYVDERDIFDSDSKILPMHKVIVQHLSFVRVRVQRLKMRWNRRHLVVTWTVTNMCFPLLSLN
jgi:hypothetical protein